MRQTERFIGMVAHDLANPISTILYAAEGALAQPPGRDDDIKTSLRRIVKTTKRMRGIVERLLDFTRVGTGRGLPLNRQVTDLRDLSEQAVAELEERYPRRITVVTVGDLTGDWDTGRLLEVFSNLLTNALVHGCFGCPVGLVLDGAQPQTVEVRVHNRGAIPASRLPTLFDPFSDGERSAGLGLGLFITKEIVAAHGGAIAVQSSKETGTQFIVQLPRATALTMQPSPL